MADPIYYNLTEEQHDALQKLKLRVSDGINEFEGYNKSFVLYRFLKARDWDVNKAELMLQKCINWRKENKMRLSVNDYQPPEVLEKYFSKFHVGTDKEGCPVFYCPLGKCDIKGLLKSAKPSEICKTMYNIFEVEELEIERKCKEEKRWLKGMVIILDFEAITLAQVTHRKGIETLLRMVLVNQDMSPERLKTIFIINAPGILSYPFNMFKSFLSFETQKKFNYFSTEGWQEKLLEFIDAAELPAFMGGVRTDPDGNPYCKTFLNQLGIVDQKYYFDQNMSSLVNSPDVNNITVPRSSSKTIDLQVENIGSVIEWEFEVKSGDIGFGVFYAESPDVVSPLVIHEKVDTKDSTETGIYTCVEAGKYFVEFDNSYSWFKGKEIFYRLKVLTPSELESKIKC